MNGRLFLGLVIAVVCAAVVAGLLIIGGPMQARQDKMDGKRLTDMRALASLLVCRQGTTVPGSPLPVDLTLEALLERCSAGRSMLVQLPDGELAKVFSYQRIDDHAFRICATFQDARRAVRLDPSFVIVEDGARFDPETGCVSAR